MRRRLTIRFFATVAVALSVTLCSTHFASAQSGWTQFKNANPAGGSGTMLQLTDGTVIVEGGNSQSWTKLTPDSTGSYANGAWSSIASMGTARLYFASNVLPDGRVFVLGGEYSGANLTANWSNTGEIYDPLANTWTPITNFPQSQFGDDPSILLPNGKILCGYVSGAATYLYDPASNSWTQAGTKLRSDRSDEETWILLPDGSVLSYDVFASASSSTGTAQRYIPSTNSWVDAGTLPAVLTTSTQGYELGPAMVLPDGRVIQVGGNEQIALYNPATNTWTSGPSLPSGMGADDAPGVILPNGHFVFLADSYLFNAPTRMFDFDYTTNTLTDITATLPSALQSDLASGAAYYRRMMVLPNGHLMLGTGSSTFWDFAPSGGPQSSWQPTISGITAGSSPNVYTLTGARLTGISQGSSYGDDVESDTNFPLVRLTGPSPSSTVTFARTTNWTPGISSAGNTVQQSVQVALPSTVPSGTYSLAVVANGIASAEVSFTVSTSTSNNNYVAAVYNSSTKTVTLTDDAADNSVTVTLKSGKLTVQGNGNTLIGTSASSAQSVVFNVGKSSIIVDAEFTNGGNNTFSLNAVKSSTTKIMFGSGNDAATLNYCNIGTLTVDGGAGTDTLTLVGTTVKNKTVTNVP